jgi:hypothetical protein
VQQRIRLVTVPLGAFGLHELIETLSFNLRPLFHVKVVVECQEKPRADDKKCTSDSRQSFVMSNANSTAGQRVER